MISRCGLRSTAARSTDGETYAFRAEGAPPVKIPATEAPAQAELKL